MAGEKSPSRSPTSKSVSAEWAEDHGHSIVSFTIDKATSGGMPARKREDLGPWLTDLSKIAQWDILVGKAGSRMAKRSRFRANTRMGRGTRKESCLRERGIRFYNPRR